MDSESLNDRIRQLEAKVDDAEAGARNWKEVWSDIRSIGEQFKAVRYPTKLDKDTAWQRFQEAVSRMKSYQSAERERSEQRRQEFQRKQEDWKRTSEASEAHKEKIIYHAESGRPPSDLEAMAAIPILAPVEAIGRVVTLGQASVFPNRRDELKQWSQRIREAWDLLSEHKGEMLGSDKKEVFERLKELQAECDEAWRAFKEEFQEARETQHREQEQRREAWRSRILGQISELEDRLSALQDKLDRKEQHLEELYGRRDNAKTDEFRERVEGWIQEEEEWIGNIKEKIEKIEGWIAEKRNLLD